MEYYQSIASGYGGNVNWGCGIRQDQLKNIKWDVRILQKRASKGGVYNAAVA